MKMMLNVDVFEVLIILSIFVNFYSSSWQHVRKIIYRGEYSNYNSHDYSGYYT